MAKQLFQFLANLAQFHVNDDDTEMLIEGSGIEDLTLGEPAIPWLGQPVPAEQVFGSFDLPPGCSFNSSGALVIDLEAVADSSGTETGLLDQWFWGDPPAEAHPFPRQGPLIQQRVELEVRTPSSLTQSANPVGAIVAAGIGWPGATALERSYLWAGLAYYPTNGLGAVHTMSQQAGTQSKLNQLDPVNNVNAKHVLVSHFGHTLPGFDAQFVGEVWQIGSDQSSTPYSYRDTADLDPTEIAAWVNNGVVEMPRPFLYINAPGSWEAGNIIEIRSFGAR